MEIEISNWDVRFPQNEYNLKDIPVLEENTTYDEFFKKFMLRNIPCVIKNVTRCWKSSYNWINCNEINLDYLQQNYGHFDATIYKCNEKHFNSHKTYKSTLNTYIEYLKTEEKDNLEYLKDWHLQNLVSKCDFYKVPIYFASDWLNEYLLEKKEDDYRFVYIGAKGTWTPFHADVFNSYSWSANVCGQKKWILFPPGEEEQLKDNLGNLPYDLTELNHYNGEYIELIQNEGDAVFIPSGWYHQVWNLKDTISINHNWVNGCNIEQMWLSIENNLNLVKKEIDDCKEMNDYLEHCQVVLEASYGLNFYKFYEMLLHIAIKRMIFLDKNDELILFNGYSLGRNHAKFDLYSIKRTLNKFILNEDVKTLDYFKDKDPLILLYKIEEYF